MMRTANPALNKKTFTDFSSRALTDTAMTIQGTVTKTMVLLLLMILSATYTWRLAATGEAIEPWMAAGGAGGFVVGLITVFKKNWAGVLAPLYALLEGLFLGGISAIFEARFPGIVIQAVSLTFGTLFALLLAYKTRLIKATENFKLGVTAATGGIVLIYIATVVMSFFGVNMPYIHESGPIGIGFSLVVVVIASLNLVLDFDFIESGADRHAPKYMEWYGAFGLMVTLIWLYFEILRLLSKLRSR
jgi:uncharacterized YccA/Bax inhibitor family protein